MSARIPLFSSARHPARDAAIGCAVVLAVALGVGRFAFTPLLPMMLASGAIDIRHGGWLASLNYAGYFIGAVTCAAISHDHAKVVRAGLATTVVLTFAMGLTDAFWLWAAVRFVAGAVSAWTFVFASQWGLRRLGELGAHQWSGVIYTGPGVGIVVTGLLAAAAGPLGAAAAWIGFAVLSAVAGAFVWRTFANDPCARRCAAPRDREAAARSIAAPPEKHRAQALWLAVLYGLPGFGYIITATFLPVIARAALPGSPWPDLFWPVFGAALIPGALIASQLPLAWDNRALLAGCYLLQAVGIALGIVFPTTAGFALGSLLIGLPFTAITLFAMREARRLRGERAAGLMGYATAAYGVGQIAGPLVAAPVAAHTGSFSIALWLAVAALVAGSAGLAWVAARYRIG
ncbi:Permeases of the major facilitator superfamily [Caballeronia glathei]|jgi:predicted MFS family arabinose efflux permease|uniref:MFS transporter n=1 Tax=Caballeronia glathei TaxID=60547 RepID=A0A069PR42_9BURK|nr:MULTISPECIES: YbfB/YjiJ family MFS transporter [Burkholderiaceae]KDR43163.1 MFS transporter [Caballeronia glathei]TCK43038.1 putative MFS family arabinose efflux permease [Paraburkholderia sp. BL8N3]CDY73659.1 Permeases of the major facilitator superfamily [Caballeronia glathei]